MQRSTDHATSAVTPSLMVDAKEVAQLINVSIATLWRMRSSGKLPPTVTLSAGCVRWRRADIERWVALGCPSQRDFLALSR